MSARVGRRPPGFFARRVLTNSIWSSTCRAHPDGWAVRQMLFRIFGSTITGASLE